ncbi:MAG TPA: DUF4126 domain-containing protein [Vicinamibacteria bacterium]|nr:DUF4126 domain-containing protein [Vicinamibacteria bacterium]
MTAAWTDVALALALGIGLAACAGIRAWLPLLMAGGAARMGWLELGDSFAFLASSRALVLFGVASVVEIVADKVPALDHLLDALSTVLRPAAGSLLAASVLWPVSDPLTALALGVAVGAPSALVPHAAKSMLRAASTSVTAGFANPIISVAEDALAVILFVVTVVLPLLVVTFMVGTVVFVVLRWRRRAPAVAAS